MTADAMAESLRRLLARPASGEYQADPTVWPNETWAELDRGGYLSVSLPEDLGGSGGTLADVATLLREVGRAAAPLPVAEHCFLGGWLLGAVGAPLPTGLVTVPVAARPQVTVTRSGAEWLINIDADRVPWARHATWCVTLGRGEHGDYIVQVPIARTTVTTTQDIAGQPQDSVRGVGLRLPNECVHSAASVVAFDDIVLRGALARSILIAGAIDGMTQLTLGYANTREQFGRRIGSFQAVRQLLVELAGESISASMAVDGAVQNSMAGLDEYSVACAKFRASTAASRASKLAHQVHGAIGLTMEYQLHRFTRRLWVWRQEFGSAEVWARRVGATVFEDRAERMWPRITGTVNGSAARPSLSAG